MAAFDIGELANFCEDCASSEVSGTNTFKKIKWNALAFRAKLSYSVYFALVYLLIFRT